MTVITCRDCGQQISALATTCPNCGCTDPNPKYERPSFQERHPVVAPALGILILYVLFGPVTSWLQSRGGPDDNPSPAVVADPAPYNRNSTANEADYVTRCDLTMKRAVRNPSSFSTDWFWDTRKSPAEIVVRRHFTAQNGFGATMDYYYVCTVDPSSGMIRSLRAVEGNYE